MFNNQTIIITGASSGLGKELGRRFTQMGANLGLFEITLHLCVRLKSDKTEVRREDGNDKTR